SLLVAMPVLETVAIHMLVIEACATAGRGRSGALYVGAVLAAIVFFLLHVLAKSIFNGLVYGLTGGVAFSVMYVVARRDGRKAAFVATWLLHLSSNALLVLSIAYYGMLLGVTRLLEPGLAAPLCMPSRPASWFFPQILCPRRAGDYVNRAGAVMLDFPPPMAEVVIDADAWQHASRIRWPSSEQAVVVYEGTTDADSELLRVDAERHEFRFAQVGDRLVAVMGLWPGVNGGDR